MSSSSSSLTSNSYAIASNLLPVLLVQQWGEALTGSLFLRDTPLPSREPEDLGTRLNEPGTHFVPFDREGRVEFVRLGSVGYVEHPAELPEVRRLRELGAQSEPVELELVTGELLQGDLLDIAPPEHCRLSDLLNQADRFLLLASPGKTVYVAREAITRVHPATGTPDRKADGPLGVSGPGR